MIYISQLVDMTANCMLLKKCDGLNLSNFGLISEDITGFLVLMIVSINLHLVDIWFLSKISGAPRAQL